MNMVKNVLYVCIYEIVKYLIKVGLQKRTQSRQPWLIHPGRLTYS